MASYLEDCEEIRQLVARYCMAFDQHDATTWASTFTTTGRFVIGPTTVEGTEALEAFAASMPPDSKTQHIATNLIIDVEGDKASSQSYLIILSPGTPASIGMTASYNDRLERIDGRWRFAERIVTPL